MSETASRPLNVLDLVGHRRVRQICVSPRGDATVFVVAHGDFEANRGKTRLYRLTATGSRPEPLTHAGNSNSDPAFSPDGEWLAFTSDRSGTPQVWVMPVRGGEPRPVTRRRLGAQRPVWLPNSKGLVVIGSVYIDSGDEDEIVRREDERAKLGTVPRIADEPMFRHWDSWSEDKIDHLHLVDLDSGACRDLTPGPFPVPPRSLTGAPDYAVSPDGLELCFTALRVAPAEQAVSTNVNLWTLPLGGGEPRRISPWAGANAFPGYSPDGRSIAYCGMRRPGYEADRRELLLYDRATGTTRELAPAFDRSAGPPVWARDGAALIFEAQDHARTRLYALALDAAEPRPLTQDATDHGPVVSADGRWIYFARETASCSPELHRVPASGGGAERLTRFADEDLGAVEMGAIEEFRYPGADGLEVHGLLLKPPAFDRALRYPVVFLIHGGPQGAFGLDFHERWNAQLFAAQGWVVALINPRGSTGYGQAFTDAIRGEWGGKCYEDLIRGFDHVLATFPFCDRSRTAAAGASFGGFMINWIAGHTDRFRCLVSHDGIFNTEMMNWATDELWFTEWEFGGLPWESPESYRQWSPHRHVEKMKTPTLVVHGERDFRCILEEGTALFTALRRRGVPARLLVFPDEGHWVQKPRNRKVWWETVLGWLGKHLGAAAS